MKTKLLLFILVALHLSLSSVIFAQAPALGAASGFALFTSTGALNNTGASSISGDVGSNSAATTGFPPGIIHGNIYNPPNSLLAQAATDVGTAYGYLSTLGGTVIGVLLGSGQIVTPGIYQTGAASSLTGNLTLDAQGDPNAIFIIRIGGAFTSSTFSSITLLNSAASCNVYWQIGGQFDLAGNSVFQGTIVVDGAINLLEGSSLFGRALSRAGAINTHNNIVSFLPTTAGTISGTPIVCQGQTGFAYSIPAIANATAYVWTLPSGASIISGATTNTISVNFSPTASSGNITVYATNACGNGIASPNYAITISPLPITSAIYHQ